jgi:hypothetical protein
MEEQQRGLVGPLEIVEDHDEGLRRALSLEDVGDQIEQAEAGEIRLEVLGRGGQRQQPTQLEPRGRKVRRGRWLTSGRRRAADDAHNLDPRPIWRRAITLEAPSA